MKQPELYDMEPFVILEGSEYLGELEVKALEALQRQRIYPIPVCDLYKNPSAIVALHYLKPKTVILFSTGVYQTNIENCLEVFKACVEHLPDNIILGMNESAIIWKYLREIKKQKPSLNIYKLKLSELDVFSDEIPRLTLKEEIIF